LNKEVAAVVRDLYSEGEPGKGRPVWGSKWTGIELEGDRDGDEAAKDGADVDAEAAG